MKFFQLLEDLHIPKRWHLHWPRTASGEVFDIPYDIELARRNPLVIELQKDGEVLDFCYAGGNVPVVRSHLARAMMKMLQDQAFLAPVTISGKPSTEVQVLIEERELNCVDESRSEFIKWRPGDHRQDLVGSYRSLSKIALDESQIPSQLHMFRIKGWSMAHIVSAKLREQMIDSGCWGARFREIESR